MVTTVLSDEIINSTELRNNQKRWLNKAYISPVSVMSGNKKLVILNREQAKHMYFQTQYAEMIIQLYREQEANKKESRVFPWIKYLDDGEIEEFKRGLLVAFERAASSREWLVLEELLDDWKATANVASNPALVKALLAEEDPSAYVRAKE